MPNRQGEDFGFTLLEMILVLMLFAGASFVLLIKIPLNFENERLALATTQLLAEIRDARQAAIAENNWYSVKFYHQTDHHYQIFKQGTRVKDVYFKDGIQFLGSPQDLEFNASGRSVGSTIILTTPSGKRRSVIVAPVGMRIREND